ncbi:MAG: hypothetical protein JXB14_02445 [Candidatus Altiarchaeota archaeon]|nr:hypothetical protein [Candidatus Altiarchaeota archaeon]
METTIQLDKATVQALKMLKKETGARSYDQVIINLIPKKSKSMFGCMPELKPFSRKDRLEDREL